MRSFGLFVVLLALALVGMESWERTAAWPVAESWYRVDEDGDEVRFRCQDFRPVRFGRLPASGVRRIVVVGGSTAFGYPERPAGEEPLARAEHGFVGALRASLDAAWPGRFELVNLGVNGGSSDDTRRLVRRARAWEPAAFVVYDGHNEFMAAPARFVAALWRFALVRHVSVLAARVQVAPGWTGPSAYGGTAHAAAVAGLFRANLDAIATLAGPVPVVVATQAANLAGLDPSWSTHGAVGAGLGDLSDEAIARRHAAEPEAADLAWEEGRRRLASGRDARGPLRAAVDHDGMPFRATSQLQAAIRDAAVANRMVLADADAAVGSTPGGELFYDNVHPRPEAARRIAAAVLDGLARGGVLPGPAPAALLPPVPPSDDALRRTAGYWLRWAHIRAHDPGWRLSRARSWSRMLLARAPGNADAAAILALADELGGGAVAALHEDPELRRRISAIHPRLAARLAP